MSLSKRDIHAAFLKGKWWVQYTSWASCLLREADRAFFCKKLLCVQSGGNALWAAASRRALSSLKNPLYVFEAIPAVNIHIFDEIAGNNTGAKIWINNILQGEEHFLLCCLPHWSLHHKALVVRRLSLTSQALKKTCPLLRATRSFKPFQKGNHEAAIFKAGHHGLRVKCPITDF